MDLHFYRAYDDGGNRYPVICPIYATESNVRGLNGDKTVPEILQLMPDFPIEATWFVNTTVQKNNLINAGVPNVFAIEEIVASGNTKWYFNTDKTKYLEFGHTTDTGTVTVVTPDYSFIETWINSDNIGKNTRIRMRTMFADAPTNGRYGYINYNTPNADGTLYNYYPNYGYPSRFADINTAALADFWDGIEPYIEPTDPYLPDGVDPSGTGGGTGTFSETGDTIGIPGLPALSAVDTGFITLFNPSAAQVKALAAYMWSSSFDLATFKNIVANPIDCILGLTIVPVDPSNAGSKTVTVGNIPTNITLPYLSSQYVEVDCGTLNVQEFWGSYLDYSPYTKMSLYLPYIGIIPLDIDDVMNASIAVKYHVDVLSGACVAYVLCNGTQLYTYVGQCSSNVPITSNDFTNTVNGILGIAGSIGKLAADGGASAPTEAAGIAANAINALKPNIQKSGAMSGTGGLMGVQTPYLICQRPRQSVPASQNTFTGYPANITAKLSDLSGYTEVDSIHLDGLSATQEEQQEIIDLLTSGVII